MAISQKMQAFAEKSSWIRKMFEEGAKMKAEFGDENVFDFSLGNPDLLPPPIFSETLRTIAAEEKQGVHGYMPNGGYPWVRSALAARISAEQGVKVSGADMLMTCGAAGAINITLKAILDPGDEVLTLTPYFVEYGFYVDNHGGVLKEVPTTKEFEIDFVALEEAITEKTKALILNSPNNPTGQIYPIEDIAGLGELLERMQKKFGTTIYLLSDEPYRKIVFTDCEVPGLFRSYRNTIILSSFSKDLSLPGERIGYLTVHPEIEEKNMLLNALTLANRILGFVNAPALMQRVVAEIPDATVDVAIYERRRDLLCSILSDAGFTFTIPKGALYLFPETPIADDVAFCSILQENRILAVPGRGFGGPGHIRIAFCVDEKVITGAAEGFRKSFAEAVK